MKVLRIALPVSTLALVLAASGVQGQTETQIAVGQTLDRLHQAASEADFDGYFALYSENAVFLGTDATERWPRSEFMAYAKARFDQGRGWTYLPIERHVRVSSDGSTAWFDERLENVNYGETRGSGVLIREDGTWKVAQYNLTIPMPNDLAAEFVARIRESAGGE